MTAVAKPESAVDDRADHRLRPLFAPTGVVVVGASSTPDKLGGVMAASLASYAEHGGHVALVNPRAEGMYDSVRSAVDAAPVDIELAIVCVPAEVCADVVAECGAHGVTAALVCAGGFAESGEPGAHLQARLLAAAAEHDVRLLGPNTSGFFVPSERLLASFVPAVATLEPGPVGVVAASGGVNHALAFALQRAGCGISLGVGIGAGVDVAAAEVLDYLARDIGTRSILLHLETISDGPALLAAVREASRRKPVVALVVGQHEIGDFAQSHTGALATSWRTTRALLRQAGAVVVDDLDELVVAGVALASARLQPRADPAAALVTAQAGPGLLIADALHHSGVRLPPLGQGTRDAVAAVLPPTTYQVNPVDTGRPGPQHGAVVSAVADDPAIDLVAVYALTEPVVDLVESACPAVEAGHVIVLGIDGPGAEVERARSEAAAAGVPLVVGSSALAAAVSALAEDARRQAADAPPQTRTATTALTLPERLTESAAKDVLDALGIATPPRRLCRSEQEAHDALIELAGPVAVKISGAGVMHKSDVGGVRLAIADAAALTQAYTELIDLEGEVLIEAMAPAGLDLIVGARRDPVFGPVVMVGVGGTATEVYADVAIASVPCSREHLASLADQLQARPMLDGHRGSAPVDRAALAEVLATLGALLLDHPRVVEVEVNPLRASADGLVALDAVLVLDDDGPQYAKPPGMEPT